MGNQWIDERSWEEFRSAGLIWWINRGLHLFGWAIVYELKEDSDEVVRVYPARCRWRGFIREEEQEGFQKLSLHLKDRIDQLVQDTLD